MRKDIILSGVGGQGLLTIATIIGEAATAEGINLKQAEVHGMSQLGGSGSGGSDYFHGTDGGVALSALLAGRRLGDYFC